MFSEGSETEVFNKKGEAVVFVSEVSPVLNKDQTADNLATHASKKLNKDLDKKNLAKKILDTKSKLEKALLAKSKESNRPIFIYKSNENKDRFYYSSLSEKSVVIPVSNNIVVVINKNFKITLPISDFSKIHFKEFLLTINYSRFFLAGYYNRPPPFLG